MRKGVGRWLPLRSRPNELLVAGGTLEGSEVELLRASALQLGLVVWGLEPSP